MKNKILLLISLAFIFIGCKEEDPELQPEAKFSYFALDLGVTFTNQSVNAKTFTWDFGDGTTSTKREPTKTYEKAGTYKVVLKATNITKTSEYVQDVIVTDVEPVAKFSYTKNELQVLFNNQSTNSESYLWDFGNGHTSTLNNPLVTYAAEGTYKVSLTAYRGELSNSYSQTISVAYSNPKANFTYKVEQPLKVVLTNTSTSATSYEWDFGDGTTSTEKNPTHKYSGIGVYKVTLVAKNHGKTSTYQANVTIEAPTTCFITGFTINKIPNNNNYYQLQLTDDYAVFKSTYFYTKWFLLSSANLPYIYNLSSEKQLNISNTYVIRLYQSSAKPADDSQADGKGNYSASITSEQLKKYPEVINWSTSNIGIELHFKWK